MILTPEQQLLLPELESHNANITRSNEAAAAHNALLPPEVEPVPIRPLLTMTEFIQYKLDLAAEAEARRVQAASKTNEQWQTEWTATKTQLDAVEADKESIEAARLQLVSDLAAKTALYDAEVAKVTTLEASVSELEETVTTLETEKQTANATIAAQTALAEVKATQVDTLTSQLATKTTDLATRTTELSEALATIAALQATAAELEQYRPYNPRILKGEAFYNRVSQEDRDTLVASEVPELQLVGRTIIAYKKNKWPVILESEAFLQLVGYVQMSGVFDQADVDAVMLDAKREEAYVTP